VQVCSFIKIPEKKVKNQKRSFTTAPTSEKKNAKEKTPGNNVSGGFAILL